MCSSLQVFSEVCVFGFQMQGQSPPASVRGQTKKGTEEAGAEADEDEADGGAGDIMDLLPRTDIRSILTRVKAFGCFQNTFQVSLWSSGGKK